MWSLVCNYRHVRVALKPVTNNPSTSDISAPKSSGGSFLDILIQGTQSAVQPAKGSGSQTQSDADTSDQNNPGQPQANSTGNTQSRQAATGANQSNTTQSLNNFLTMANQAAAGKNAALISSETAQATTAPNQSASGKQAGASKGTQSKQSAAAPTDSGTVSARQVPVLTVPTAVVNPIQILPLASKNQAEDTANSAQDAAVASKLAATAEQTGSLMAATAAQAAAAATRQVSDQPSQQAANSRASDAQNQQPTPSSATAAASFQHDLAALAATAAKSNVPDLTADASSAPQASDQKPAQTFIQTADSALSSAQLQQNDPTTNQTTAKVIPFKIGTTNLGNNSNVPSTTTASSSALGAPTAATSNRNSQNSSNTPNSSPSGHDGQGSGDTAANPQSATTTVRSVDAGTGPTAALGTFAAAHAAAQPDSPSAASDATSAHAGTVRNLPSEPASASLPAGSSAINSARVIQSMNETEMRVGMHSAEFGDISIRTMVTQQQVQAQISVDHSELVNALAAHIPAAQAKIGAEYGLHASIEVSQGGASFTGNPQQQLSQKDYKPFAASAQIDSSAPLIETDRAIARPMATSIVEGSRLDIRA